MFNIGQFRRDMISYNSYTSSLAYRIDDIQVDSGDYTEAIFIDKAIKLTSTSFEYGKNYYVRIGVTCNETSDQNLVISLQNSAETSTSTQVLGTYFVPQDILGNSRVAVIELIISPNGSYDQVVVALQRKASDYLIDNGDGTYGRVLTVTVLSCAEIYNVLNQIGQTSLIKIGVQGPPGLLMCINGEDIRIGPSGIYEIKNSDYKITFIGFIIQESDTTPDRRDYFILDYQYE